MIGMRSPTVADSHEQPVEECLGELRRATDAKDSFGDPVGPTFELEVGQRRT